MDCVMTVDAVILTRNNLNFSCLYEGFGTIRRCKVVRFYRKNYVRKLIRQMTSEYLGLYGQVNKRIWWMPRR